MGSRRGILAAGYKSYAVKLILIRVPRREWHRRQVCAGGGPPFADPQGRLPRLHHTGCGRLTSYARDGCAAYLFEGLSGARAEGIRVQFSPISMGGYRFEGTAATGKDVADAVHHKTRTRRTFELSANCPERMARLGGSLALALVGGDRGSEREDFRTGARASAGQADFTRRMDLRSNSGN